MTIEFPKEKENFSPQEAYVGHKRLAEYHIHFMKLQSECEFFYWKLTGFFFLSILVAFILHDKGVLLSPSGAITIIGFGFLLIFAQNCKSDLKYSVGSASCLEKGLAIEKRYNYSVRLFKIFEENKSLTYRANLLNRSVPFVAIGLATLISGCILASKIGAWLSAGIALFAGFALYMFARFYHKRLKSVLLNE